MKCRTCGQEITDREALIRVHVEALRNVLDMIDSGQFFVEDFPQLKVLGRLLTDY